MTASRWDHFTQEELACQCGCGHGEDRMDDTFMRTMVLLRGQAGFVFPVSSGYRCPDHNDAIYVKRGAPVGGIVLPAPPSLATQE